MTLSRITHLLWGALGWAFAVWLLLGSALWSVSVHPQPDYGPRLMHAIEDALHRHAGGVY